MDNKTAAVLLTSLMERVDRDQVIGTVSSLERKALVMALAALTGVEERETPATLARDTPVPTLDVAAPIAPKEEPSATLPAVELVLTSIERDAVTTPDVLLCLDFGTAMSKAFAAVASNQHLDLELGSEAGRQGYALPSSVFISNDGKAYFGFEAVELSQELIEAGRERLDSIKGWISLRSEGNLDGEAFVLGTAMNPTENKLTQGDLIRIYLAYLTDIAELSLAYHSITDPRHAKRRFARPCWPNLAQAQWADGLMRTMLAEAQILADTFHDRWNGGIPVAELKAAVEKIKALGRRPDYLIAEGVPEPVAVAAGAFSDSDNMRDAFMVVDVGAGTTDFGLFISTHHPDSGEQRVFQAPQSIHGLMQAGDKIDGLLRASIAKRESIDTTDTSGRMILSSLTLQIRSLKEILFRTGTLEYSLSDGTTGKIGRDEFLAEETVKRFGQAVEDGFKKTLTALDDTWLRWLAMDGVNLHVVLTGGSSSLPMMLALADGVIEVKGHRIMRKQVNPTPRWMEDMPKELLAVYPQLAVAIGGAAESMPETLEAPPTFGGGTRKSYVAGSLHVAGS